LVRVRITAYTVRTDAFRELLEVAQPLERYPSAPRSDVIAALDACRAYYVKYPKRRWGAESPRDDDTSTQDLRWIARCTLDGLLHSGPSSVRVNEPLDTGMLDTTLHAYARALTNNPNWAPVHNESTQIINGRCTWLFPEQLREMITWRSALEVPDRERLRAEYRRQRFLPRTDEELDAESIAIAGRWIRIVQLAELAIKSGLTYVAYAESDDAD
jgi:hypothetical protein